MQRYADNIADYGFTRAAIVETKNIAFLPELRKSCEANVCGSYGTNWMCPPGVGEPEELKKRVLGFENGLLVQKVYDVEDSFDIEGMTEAGAHFDAAFSELFDRVKEDDPTLTYLPLSAGGCRLCPRCAYLDTVPCRQPGRAISSVEAYAIHVGRLTQSVGIPYINGVNTVSFVALILYK